MYNGPVAVCSRTFSKHPKLRDAMKSQFSNVVFNDEGLNLSGEELIKFISGKDGVIVALEKVTHDVISQLPSLKVVSKYGVGLDNVDIDSLKKNNIQLGWTGGVNRRSVSELTLGFALDLLRKITQHHNLNKSGQWKNLFGNTLTGKRIGIIGCGFIGKDLVEILKPFKCEVFVNDLLDVSDFARSVNATPSTKEDIFKTCDIITLHVPYSSETHHLVSAHQLSLMKPNAILINTSRGNVVDEESLYKALTSKQIAGAALDVFAEEPPKDLRLLQLENFVSTPHVGGSSEEAILSMGQSAIDNLYALLSKGRL